MKFTKRLATLFTTIATVVAVLVLMPTQVFASGGIIPGYEMPGMVTIIPFVVLLLCIAILPLLPATGHWWHKNGNKLLMAMACGIPIMLYYWFARDYIVDHSIGVLIPAGWHAFEYQILHHTVLNEFVPFIVLLFCLYAISGGIFLRGDLKASPLTNTGIIAIGALLASFIGTTGASMLLIRPLIQTNAERKYVKHTVIFFIFLVSNIGGCLLPIGDPPLFLGYLRGVPFMWTFKLTIEWAFALGLVLIIYYIWDTIAYRKEPPAALKMDEGNLEPIRVNGFINFVWLLGVVLAVAMLVPNKPFLDKYEVSKKDPKDKLFTAVIYTGGELTRVVMTPVEAVSHGEVKKEGDGNDAAHHVSQIPLGKLQVVEKDGTLRDLTDAEKGMSLYPYNPIAKPGSDYGLESEDPVTKSLGLIKEGSLAGKYEFVIFSDIIAEDRTAILDVEEVDGKKTEVFKLLAKGKEDECVVERDLTLHEETISRLKGKATIFTPPDFLREGVQIFFVILSYLTTPFIILARKRYKALVKAEKNTNAGHDDGHLEPDLKGEVDRVQAEVEKLETAEEGEGKVPEEAEEAETEEAVPAIKIRRANKFTFFAIAEVACLFIGIFIAMQTPIEILNQEGSQLGINTPAKFFWATGSLSAFLDNAPTYVVFFETAKSFPASDLSGYLNLEPDLLNSPEHMMQVTGGSISVLFLIAISLGAVFMGAMTYIGNAPNFMVKSIAEEAGIKMPSFFGYMAYSVCVLVPVFIIVVWLFL